MVLGIKNMSANAENIRDPWIGFDPWIGKIPWSRAWQTEKRNGQILQYACLENPMDRGT